MDVLSPREVTKESGTRREETGHEVSQCFHYNFVARVVRCTEWLSGHYRRVEKVKGNNRPRTDIKNEIGVRTMREVYRRRKSTNRVKRLSRVLRKTTGGPDGRYGEETLGHHRYGSTWEWSGTILTTEGTDRT